MRPVPVARRVTHAWPWAVGAGAAVAVLGPALRPGSLLSLDLVLVPRVPVPSGVWGLGPELPRRVPYGVALAWASNVVGGAAAGKALLGLAIAGAVVGATRLVRDAPPLVRLGAGLVYGLSPFLLTRIGAGHLGVVAAFAILPWALPVLLRPADRVPATLLWSAALGVTGVAGGTVALAVIAAGLVADRGRRLVAVAGAGLVGQLPWVVPGVVVALAGVRLNPSGRFPTRADGVVGLLGLPAGHGFWRGSSQVGGDTSAGVAVLGGVLLALAVAGMSRLPAAWGRRATAVAGVGATLALASALPGARAVYAELTSVPLLAPARESQRWLTLFLVWLAPAAALGAARLGSRAVAAVPAACAVALAVPGLWGVGGRLEPVDLPPGWAEVAANIDARPGPVLALPWHQYLDLRAADGRRVLHPMPDYLGGDVLSSSDPELASGRQEETDPREPVVALLLERLRGGERVASDLVELGVRWVVLLHEVDWREHIALRADPGLRRVVADASVELFEVRAWRGPVLTASGDALSARAVAAPLARVGPSGRATWHRPAAPGWLRGWERAGRTPVGTIALPAGRGVVWFWPTLVVLAAYVCTVCAVWRAGRACKPKEASVPSDSRRRSAGVNGADGTV